MVDSGFMVAPGTFGSHGKQKARRRPSFPQGGLDWHIRRKTSVPRSVRHAPATMSDLANEDDDSVCENNGCCCGEQKNISGVTVTLTDDNQNASTNTSAKKSNNLCVCNNSKRLVKKHRKPPKTTIFINVGGQIFETYKSTLKKMKNSVLADESKMRHFWRPEVGDYFFDRDPQGFASILNYFRTGELHIPTNMCGPSLQNELTFWGVDELDIERCCWTQYNTWKTQSRSLEKLEYDRKSSTTQDTLRNEATASCWKKCRWKIWRFLQDATSSRGAKVYAWISIIFVLVSIFSFCAETHPLFQVMPQQVTEEWRGLYQFLNLKTIDWSAGGSGNETETGNISYDGNDTEFTEVVKKRTRDMSLPHPCLMVMDLACLAYFTLEYFTRFICSPSKVKFLRALQNIIDFIAIAPDYINIALLFIQPSNGKGMVIMDFMFILRMLRLCRIFRLIRHVPGLWILLYTLKASFNELMLMFVFLLIGMVVFASLMHFAEGENGFDNIPIGFWWSVVTMTTVGYGDMYPQTAFGYVIGSLCAVAGLLMIAFTVPIIVSNFVLYYTHVQYGLARRDRDRDIDTDKEEEEEVREMDVSDTNVSPVVLSSKVLPDNTAIELGENVSLTASIGSATVSEPNFRTLTRK